MSHIDRALLSFFLLFSAVLMVREFEHHLRLSAYRPPIVVSVTGAVARPGVIRLPADARVLHAIDECGGVTANADITRLELARPLQNGDSLTVPTVGQPPATPPSHPSDEEKSPGENRDDSNPPSTMPGPDSRARPGRDADAPKPATRKRSKPSKLGPGQSLNVNKATVDELVTLPGVGKVMAQRIVEARESAPGHTFSSLEELAAIRGIKGKMLLRLEPYLKLEGL